MIAGMSTGTGGAVTVKVTAFEVWPPVVTVTLLAPAVRLAGTVAVIEVALQAPVAAAVPPMVTVPEVPRLVPVRVTALPARPLVGATALSAGAGAGTGG